MICSVVEQPDQVVSIQSPNSFYEKEFCSGSWISHTNWRFLADYLDSEDSFFGNRHNNRMFPLRWNVVF